MSPTKTSECKIILFIFSISLITACSNDKEELLIGKWQSLNERNLSIEFDGTNKKLIRLELPDGQNVRRDTQLVWDSKYKVFSKKRDRLVLIENLGGDESTLVSEVKFKNDNRMILSIYKHHGILDMADEFARTSSPHKFDSIMHAIMATPE